MAFTEDKANRNIEFRDTMKTLNEKFIEACQNEVMKAPDCILIPLIQNYLSYFQAALTKLSGSSNDLNERSFDNVGDVCEIINNIKTLKETSKLGKNPPGSPSQSSQVYHIELGLGLSKSTPPLNELPSKSSEVGHIEWNLGSPRSVSPKNHNWCSQMGTSASREFSYRLSGSPEEKRMIISATAAFKSTSEPYTLISTSTQCPNYFKVESKQNLDPIPPTQPPTSFVCDFSASFKTNSNSPAAAAFKVFPKVPTTFTTEGLNPNSMSSPNNRPIKSFPVPDSAFSFHFGSSSVFSASPNLPHNTPQVISSSVTAGTSTLGSFESPHPESSSVLPQPFQNCSKHADPLNSNLKPTKTVVNENDDDDKNDEENENPPKNEFTPVVESDSVYNIKCKVFNLVDGAYKDKGVGQLYIKTLNSGKHQLVVRADNALGTVLLNLVLSKSLPFSRKSNRDLQTVDPHGNNGNAVTVLIRAKDELSATALLGKITQFQDCFS